jgi:drug/metabolite transporter (DMT)-like permease
MQRRTRIDALGATLLLGFTLLMGVNQPMMKIVNEGLAPAFQAGLRSLCAFPLILGYALLAGRRLALGDGSLWPGIAAGLLFAVEFILLFEGIEHTSVARASVMVYSMPVWVALGAHFLIPGERLSRRRALGLALAVAGVATALLRNEAPLSPLAFLGDLMCLGAALLWAATVILIRTTALSRSGPEMQLLYQLGVSAVVMIAYAVIDGPVLRLPNVLTWTIFSAQVVFVVAVGFLTWFWVLQVYPASDMAAFGFLSPVFGVVAGRVVLGEPVTPSVLVALALVGAGIFLVAWKPRGV